MADNFSGNYTILNNGTILADTADILETVQNEYKNVFGQDISLEESTPQGRLIDTEVMARSAVNGMNAQMANILINIALSSGPALDAWGANFDIPRDGATASQVNVIVTGVANTVIPVNSQALDDNGIIWLNESEIVIGTDGTATGTFICSQAGPIELGTGQLKTVVASSTTGINGWEIITNPSVAALGSYEQSDFSYKLEILNSIFNGTALFGNYKSACFRVANVIDVFTYDNPYGTALTLDNIEIPAHSVYVCVDGGNSQEIANALYTIKSAGCGWCGNTTVTVIDPDYMTSNTVIYQVPTESAFQISISATNISNSNANLEQEIQNVILGYFQGQYAEQGFSRPDIRAIISPFVLSALLTSQIQGVRFDNVQAGLTTVKAHAIANVLKASITSGITWASVDTATFGTQITVNGTYNFTFNGSNWVLNNSTVNLNSYGITLTGLPITGDIISILYSTGELSQNPIQIFASEKASISEENITVKING